MLRIVLHTVPRVGRSHEHFPDGFELCLLRVGDEADAPLDAPPACWTLGMVLL